MASYEESLKKIQKKNKQVVKKWNSNNTTQITTDDLTTALSKKEQEKERKRRLAEQERKRKEAERKKKEEEERKKREREAERKRRRENLKRENEKNTKRRVMTEKAKESQNKAMNTYAYPRAILGTLEGAVNATTGLSTENDGVATEETKQSKAYKAGKVAGQVLSYATGYGSIAGATTKVAGKALSTKAGKALTTKLAKNKIVKEAAKKTLKKQGQNVTEKAVEHMARKNAKKLAEGLVRNAVGDATLGTVMDSNIARSKGYEIGSDEWNKEMAINAALNVGVGGAVEVAPTVAKALGNTKVAQNVSEGLVKASDKANAIGDKVNAKLPKKKVKAPAVKETVKAELPEPAVKAETQDSIPNNEVVTNVPAQATTKNSIPSADNVVEAVVKNTDTPINVTSKALTEQEIFEKTAPERFRTEAVDEPWNETTDNLIADGDFGSAMQKEYGSFEGLEMAAESYDLSINDFMKMKKSEYDMFGSLKAPAKQVEVPQYDESLIASVDELAERLRNAEQRASDTELLVREGDMAITRRGDKLPYEEWKQDRLAAIDEYNLAKQEFDNAVENLPPPGVVKAKTPEAPETVGGFEVEGDTSLGIVSKDFKLFSDWFDGHVRTKWEKFRKQFITGQQEIERFEKVGGIESTKGRTQAVRNANGTLAYIFNEKLVDSAGKVLDDRSYKQLIEQIPEKDLPEFNRFAQHQHNIYRIAVDPEKAVYRQTSAAESEAIVKDILSRHKEFKDYSANITEWWNKFTKAWLLDTGRMTQEAYDAMLKKYPHYIPTYRADKHNGIASLANHVNAGKAVGGAVGGTSEVEVLQNGFLKEMRRIVTSTRKNDLYASIIDELRKNPEQLKQFGVAVDDAPAVMGDDITDFLDKIDEEGLKAVKDRVAQVTAYIDGKPQSAYISMEMLDALKFLDNVIDDKRLGMFVNAGKAITNPAKALITGLNPLFAFANAMRDLPTLYIQSQNGVWQTTSNIGKAIMEIARGGEKYELYKALGGKHAGYFAQGKGFADIKNYTSNPLRKAWRGIESGLSALGETTETIPRLAEFISTLEKYGGDKDAALKALYDAGEVTVNFSRSAPATKVLDAWTLYLNAAVQGLDKFGRTMKAHPLRTTARSATVITVPYAALMIANLDNPHYQDLNERTKQNYFCIPNVFGEKDTDGNAMTFIKVPVNREYGALFGSMLDVIGGYLTKEENPWEGMGETISSNFLPPGPLRDNVLAPIRIDLPNNKDFAGRTIVPTNLLKASPKNQYDAKTSGAAMGIATAANNLAERLPATDKLIPETLKSPKKVDFLIDSYGGYLGSVAQSATAQGAETPKDFLKENILQGTIIDPFLDRFTADSRYSSGVLEDFYNDMAKIETGKVDEGLKGTNGVNYVKMKVYTDISEQLTDLSKQEKEILSNSSLTKAQKEKQISALRQQKNELARSAKAKADAAEKEYKSAPEFAVLSSKAKEKWEGSGVSKQAYAKAYNAIQTKDGKKADLAGAMEMYKAGVEYKAATAVSGISEDAWRTAKNLANSGITPAQLQEMATQIDRNDNKSYSKDEITGFLNGSNYSQTQKAYLFSAFATWRNAQNPY